jgi:hypothetical protein
MMLAGEIILRAELGAQTHAKLGCSKPMLLQETLEDLLALGFCGH